MMKTRQIKYINPEEDTLEQEVNWAANMCIKQCFAKYCK